MKTNQLILEILIRIILLIFFIVTNDKEPFHRVIQPEEWWLYRNPQTQSFYPSQLLYLSVTVVPFGVILFFAVLRKDYVDFKQGLLGTSLAQLLNGAFTNTLKLLIARPRPDFFYRCFKDGVATKDFICNGDPDSIREGLKSFPSGHSSFITVCYCFLSLYIAGKLHVFEDKGRGITWRLLVACCPLYVAIVVATTRTMDYHHHYQDVAVGVLLGLVVAYIIYYQYYPPLTSPHCGHPLEWKSPSVLPRTVSEASIFRKGYEQSVPIDIKEM